MFRKVYLTLQAVFHPDGRILPICFEWHGDFRVDIDRVLAVERRAPRHVGFEGGVCIEYKCMIMGKVRFLYFEAANDRWFIEAEEANETAPDACAD